MSLSGVAIGGTHFHIVIRDHYIPQHIQLYLLSPLWPHHKIFLSTIDHDPSIMYKKFKEFETALFEILKIEVLMYVLN